MILRLKVYKKYSVMIKKKSETAPEEGVLYRVLGLIHTSPRAAGRDDTSK